MIRRRARRRLAAGRRGVPAAPLHAHRGAVARLRRRVRRRRRGRAHRRLPGGRAAAARASPGGSCSSAVLDAHPDTGRRLPARAAPTSSSTCRGSRAPGDLVLTLGAGDLTTAARRVARRAAASVTDGAPTAVATAAGLATRRGGASRAAAVERDVPLADLTTYRVGGPAAVLVRVDVAARARRAGRRRWPTRVPAAASSSGGARTCSSPTRGFDGLAVVLEGEFDDGRPRRRTATRPGRRRRCRSRCSPARAAAAGLAGLEFFVGIPGTRRRRGADERRRARARDRRGAASTPRSSTSRPGRRPARRSAAADLDLGYRRSALAPDRGRRWAPSFAVAAATAAELRGARRRDRALAARAPARRRERGLGVPQPARRLRRPAHRRARAQGPAGRRRGRVGRSTPTSSRPSRARPPTTCTALVLEVRRRVLDATGIELVPELRLVGFDDDGRRRSAMTRRAPAARAARPTRPAARAPPRRRRDPRRDRWSTPTREGRRRLARRCSSSSWCSSAACAWACLGVAAARRRPDRRARHRATSPPPRSIAAAGDRRGRRDGVARPEPVAVRDLEALPWIRAGHGRPRLARHRLASPCTSAAPVACGRRADRRARRRRHRAGARDVADAARRACPQLARRAEVTGARRHDRAPRRCCASPRRSPGSSPARDRVGRATDRGVVLHLGSRPGGPPRAADAGARRSCGPRWRCSTRPRDRACRYVDVSVPDQSGRRLSRRVRQWGMLTIEWRRE